MAINPTNNTLIRDLIHDNNVYFQKIDNEREYIKTLLSKLEPLLCQCGVAMAQHQNCLSTSLIAEAGNISSKVAIAYENIHLWRCDIKRNLDEIDKIRGAKNEKDL